MARNKDFFVNSTPKRDRSFFVKEDATPKKQNINIDVKPVNISGFVQNVKNEAKQKETKVEQDIINAGYKSNDFTEDQKKQLISGNYSINPTYNPDNKFSQKLIYTGDANIKATPTLGQRVINTAEKSGRTAMDLIGNVATGVTKGMEGYVDTAVGAGGTALSGLSNLVGQKELSQNIKNKAEQIAGYGFAKDMQNLVNEKSQQGAGIYNPSVLGLDVRDAAQEIARMYSVGMTGGLPGLMVSATGGNIEEALNEGESLGRATTYGAISGSLEGIVEKMFDPAKILGGGLKTIGKGFLGKIAEATVGEGAEEGITAALNPFIKMLTYKGDVENPFGSWDNFKNYLRDIGQSVYQGAIIGGLTLGVSAPGNVDLQKSFRDDVHKAVEKIQGVNQARKNEIANTILEGANQTENVAGLPKTEAQNQAQNQNIERTNVITPNRAKMPQNANMEQIAQTPNLPTQKAQETLQSAKIAGMTDMDIQKAKELNDMLRSGTRLNFYDEKTIPQNIQADKAKIANGFYKDGTLWINKNSKNKVEQILGHELTHHLETTDSYTDLSNTILDSEVFYDFIAEKGYANVAEYKTKLKEMGYNDAQLDNELVARFVEEKMFTDQKSIDRLARQNTKLVEKIKNWISDLVVSFKGTAQEKELLRIENMYRKALEQSRNSTNAQNLAYSIKEDANGKFVKVDTDQDIFEGINEKDYNKIAKMYMQDYLKGTTKLTSNDEAIIDTRGIRKYTNPQQRTAYFDEKMFLTPELKNVLEIAEKVEVSEANKDNSKYDNWEYYKFNFEIGDRTFEGLINIGIDKNGYKHFYEINKIHPIGISSVSTNSTNRMYSNNSINQNDSSVNTEYAQENKKDTAGKEPAFSMTETDVKNYLEKNSMELRANGSLVANNLTDKQIKDLVKIYKANGYEDVSTDYLVGALQRGSAFIPREVADVFIEKQLGYKPQYDTTKIYEDAEGNKLTKEQVEFYKDSAVRDIRGRLIPVYHRTDSEFYTFDKNASARHGKKYGQGFYFSITPENYGNREMKVYLNAKEGEFKYVPKQGYYIVQEPNQIKDVTNTKPTSNSDIRFSLNDSEGRTLSKEQQEFFKDSKARDEDGNLQVAYHGTYNGEFYIFDKDKANPENDFGKGFYLTTDLGDVQGNYEGGGPDFDRKVSKLAERIMDEEDVDYDKAEEIARERLYVDSNLIEAYVNIKNPAIVGETYLFTEDDFEDALIDMDIDDYGGNEDAYYEDVEYAKADYVANNILWGMDDVDGIEDVKNIIYEAMYEGGIGVQEFKDKVNEALIDAGDEEGNLISSEVVRQIIESLGYDGIIDPTVSTKFNMHIPKGTKHYIVFNSNQIKNVDNTNPTENPDIRYSMNPVEVAKNTSKSQESSLLNEIAPIDDKKLESVEEKETTASILTKSPKRPAKDLLKQSVDVVMRKLVDAGNTINTVGKLTGDKHLYEYFNNTKQARQSAEYMIGEAQTDIKGNRVGNSLIRIFSEVRSKGDAYTNEFFEYLLHMHNIDRMAQNKPVFGASVTAEDSRKIANQLLEKHPEFEKQANKVYAYNRNLMQWRVDSGLISKEQADLMNEMYPHYVPTFRDVSGTSGSRAMQGTVQIANTVRKATGSNKDIMPIDASMARQTMQTVQAAKRNLLGNRLLNDALNNKDKVGEYIQAVEKTTEQNDLETELDTPKDTNLDSNNNVFKIFRNGETYVMQVNNGIYEGLKSISSEIDNTDTSLLLKPVKAANNMFKKLITGYSPMFTIKNFARDIQDAGLYSKNLRGFLKKYPKTYQEMMGNGKMWQLYKSLGGTGSSFFDYETGIEKTLDTQNKTSTKIKDATLGKVEELNMMIEQAPRFAEFMATIEKAGNQNYDTLMEAMLNAADITVNFGRSGTWGKALNSTAVPFFNPSIQGFDKLTRTVLESKDGKKAAKLILRASLLGILPSVLNELLYSDDDEYENLTDRDKDTNFLIKLEDNKWIKIPKGRVLSIFGNTATRALRTVKGEEWDFGEYAKNQASQTAPISVFDSNLYSPIQAVQNNKTWYGSDIVPQRLQDYAPKDQYDENTDAFSKWLGGKINYSPKKINYLIDAYTGVIGDVVLPLTTPKAETNPFTKAFVLDGVTSNEISNDFYNMLDKYNPKQNPKKSAKEVSRYLNKQSSQVSDIYKQIREVENSDISDEEKRKQVRELRELANTIELTAMATVPEYEKAVDKYRGTFADEDVDSDYAYLFANRDVFGAEYAVKTFSKSLYNNHKDENMNTFFRNYFTREYFQKKLEPKETKKTTKNTTKNTLPTLSSQRAKLPTLKK